MSNPDEMSAENGASPPRRPVKRRVIVVTGAKGGVGKTLLSTNLALYLATIGRRVVVVDADPVGANAHTMLGVDMPPVAAEAIETLIPGLSLMRMGFDDLIARALTRREMFAELFRLDTQYVVVDLGAVADPARLDFALDADISLFVTLPEPTAIENTYRYLRSSFARHLLRLAPSADERLKWRELLAEFGGTPAPLDLVRKFEERGDADAKFAQTAMESFHPRVVLNQTRVRADLELGDAIRSAARRRYGTNIEYLGYIDYDDTVWSCIRNRRPLLIESPGTKASKSIEKIARRILAIETGKQPKPNFNRGVPFESYHDLLEVERGATDEEIRRAYKRVREIYSKESLACYGLFTPQELESARVRIEEAYDVLLDPVRRRPYELSVFPAEPEPVEEESPEIPLDSRPPPPVITPDTEFSGSLLRAVRESLGIDLKDVSQKTKIGVGYLQSIEQDDFPSLPALVYVRGFVHELAKYLRLDPVQVSATYIRRYRRFLNETGEEA